MGTEVRTFRPCRTLKGLFDAYCHVCWNPVYLAWIDTEDPGGKCMFGHKSAHDCPDAMGRARFSAEMQKLRDRGLLSPRALQTPADGGRDGK